jgi:hypothetical protein
MAEGVLHEGKGGEPFEELEGVLAGCTWYIDPGNPDAKIKPRYRLEIDIRDETDNYCVQTTLGAVMTCKPLAVRGQWEFEANKKIDQGVTGGWMVASYLNGVQPGEAVKLSCTPGTDVEKVTAAWLWVSDGRGGWKIAERDQFPGDPVERLRLAIATIEKHAAWREPRPRKGGPSMADTVEKCPQEREFWGLSVQHGWPNPNAPGARECYIVVFSAELKRPIADFEDLSPRNWGEMAKIVDMVGSDATRWPKPVKAWMQDRLEAKAAAADSPAEIEHSDNALEDSPFGKDTVGPGAGDPAHVNVAPGRMAQLQGVEFTTGELRGLMAICASKSLKHIELIPIAIAAGHRTAERIIEFADNYQVPKDDRYDALDEPAGVRE